MNIFVNDEVIEMYRMFGEPRQRMIEALSLIADGTVEAPLDDRPTLLQYSPPIKNAKRIELQIPENTLENLPNGTIRPLLYWFIEEEVYADVGWKINRVPSRWCYPRIIKSIKSLRLLLKVLEKDDKNEVENMIGKLTIMGEKYGKTESDISKASDKGSIG